MMKRNNNNNSLSAQTIPILYRSNGRDRLKCIKIQDIRHFKKSYKLSTIIYNFSV